MTDTMTDYARAEQVLAEIDAEAQAQLLESIDQHIAAYRKVRRAMEGA